MVRKFEEIKRKIIILIHKIHELVNTWQYMLPPLDRMRVIIARVESRVLSIILGHNKSFEFMENVSKMCIIDLSSKHYNCRE